MCFDLCTINIRVSIRVRGLHLVFGWKTTRCFRRSRLEKSQDIQNGSYDLLEKILDVHSYYPLVN